MLFWHLMGKNKFVALAILGNELLLLPKPLGQLFIVYLMSLKV